MERIDLNKYFVLKKIRDRTFFQNIKEIVPIEPSRESFLLINKENVLYGFGHNRNGRLGIETPYTNVPMQLKGFERHDPIKQIAYSRTHVMMLTEPGEVYVWGVKRHKHLPRKFSQPMLVKELKGKIIVEIACKNGYCSALTSEGEVLEWERTYLASKENAPLCITNPTDRYSAGIKIKKIVCGKNHTVALSEDGVFYIWAQHPKHYGVLSCFKIDPSEMDSIITDLFEKNKDRLRSIRFGTQKMRTWGLRRLKTIYSRMGEKRYCGRTNYNDIRDVIQQFSPMTGSQKMELSPVPDITKFDDEETNDLIIVVQEKFIHVHKEVLSNHCNYFRNMFQLGYKETHESVIYYNDFPYRVYKNYFSYIYTGKLNHFSTEEIFELFSIADMYVDEKLELRCAEALMERVHIVNVFDMYHISSKYNSKVLKELAQLFVIVNMADFPRYLPYHDISNNERPKTPDVISGSKVRDFFEDFLMQDLVGPTCPHIACKITKYRAIAT